MYGQGLPGTTLALTGIAIVSQVSAVIAITMVSVGVLMIVINHRRRHGARP